MAERIPETLKKAIKQTNSRGRRFREMKKPSSSIARIEGHPKNRLRLYADRVDRMVNPEQVLMVLRAVSRAKADDYISRAQMKIKKPEMQRRVRRQRR